MPSCNRVVSDWDQKFFLDCGNIFASGCVWKFHDELVWVWKVFDLHLMAYVDYHGDEFCIHWASYASVGGMHENRASCHSDKASSQVHLSLLTNLPAHPTLPILAHLQSWLVKSDVTNGVTRLCSPHRTNHRWLIFSKCIPSHKVVWLSPVVNVRTIVVIVSLHPLPGGHLRIVEDGVTLWAEAFNQLLVLPVIKVAPFPI